MTAAQIQAVRTEYLRLADEAAKSGKHEAKEAFDHAAEILLRTWIKAGKEARAEVREFLAARQPATA